MIGPPTEVGGVYASFAFTRRQKHGRDGNGLGLGGWLDPKDQGSMGRMSRS